MMLNTFEKEPDFVNELGVKWWKDESTTRYAQKSDQHGTKLDVVCYYIEEPAGHRTRLLINKVGEIVEEDQNLEGLAIKIDVRKFLKRDHEKTPNENP
jgi:hypothetical protein